ncbi:hypothetical protein [Streptomyces gardneri]|uniref:hypothetical protein n=1 Tax=Streptomyces gardneri TaxID=66892 RepID=UPI003698D3D4
MSLSTLREMNFTTMSDNETDAVSGGRLSKAQCAAIWANAQANMLGYGCGGSYTDYMGIYNRECR